MRINIIRLSLFLTLCPLFAIGQAAFNVEMRVYKSQDSHELLFPEEGHDADSLKLQKLINAKLQSLYGLGYLACTYQIKRGKSHEISVNFFAGEPFRMAMLNTGNVPSEILNKAGYSGTAFSGRSFSYNRIARLINSILDHAENNGYPFASVKLDSIKITNHEISAMINYQPGPYIIFDSLYLKEFDKVKEKYIMAHLGIYKGKPYEEKLIREISNKLKLLSFVTLTEKPEIIISEGKCSVGLALRQNKVSRIDGIIGVLPNQKDGNKVLITGRVNLDLRNLFTSGKRLMLNWQSYDALSQLLDVLYFHPNLFRTPLNIQGDFHLLKQDTTFLNRRLGIELSLLSKNSSMLGFRSEFISSRLISTYGYEDAGELPYNSDYNLNYYGLNYNFNRLNDPLFPISGWSLALHGSVGQKKIIRNPAFKDEVYKGIDMNTLQYRVKLDVIKYWKIVNNFILKTQIGGGHLSGSYLFRSDLFRLGGLNSLRGFAENRFYVSGYAIGSIEFRAVFSGQTYFMVFFDQSVINEAVGDGFSVQSPFGTGGGFSFNTAAGTFSIVLALGKSERQSFSFSQAKIHFGYVGRF